MSKSSTVALLFALLGCGILVSAALADEPSGQPAPPEQAAAPEAPPAPTSGQNAAPPLDLQVVADTVWTLVAAFLVFWMNAGFGCVEAGFCRAKNAVNILGKNFVVFGISSLAFWAIGFAIMFGDGDLFAGHSGWFLHGADNSPAVESAYQGVYSSLSWAGIPLLAKFFFQLVFAGTAATIVSGCVAERIHYRSYMIFVVFLVGISYAVTGHWIWGGGWLANNALFGQAMWDFAGSTVVHSVGGWAGLIGILLLGPRIGKYRADGSVRAIPGHSMALAFLGGLILWLGWFGFNPGSFMAADPAGISHVVVTTNLACAAGLLAATLTAWLALGKPDFSMTVNGALAGLVAITAPCAFVSPGSSIAIGLVAGMLVVGSVLFFDRLRIDDPVGALSVHLTNGVWGTLSVGIFAERKWPGGIDANGLLFGGGAGLLGAQLVGVLAVGLFTTAFSLVALLVIKAVVGLRVEPEAELAGLDVSEMGMQAYPPEPQLPGISAPAPAAQTPAEPYGAVELYGPRLVPKVRPAARTRTAPRIARPAPPPLVEAPAPAVVAAPAGPAAPEGAAAAAATPAAPPAGRARRFRIAVDNVDPKTLRERWRELCGEGAAAPPEFEEVRSKVVSFRGTVFQIRDGDPEEFRRKAERLFRSYIGPGLSVRVVQVERG